MMTMMGEYGGWDRAGVGGRGVHVAGEWDGKVGWMDMSSVTLDRERRGWEWDGREA
jgi:hypothetical protein